ncbi:MAG: hypothetical protein JST92_04025 [Deltaproteobacteria bacterium]|nr:hypothetical protein [Deltaproteobacteria bacterium]
MPDPTLDDLLKTISPEDVALFRSVRARVMQSGQVSERVEVRELSCLLQGGVLFLRAGTELAYLVARSGSPVRLVIGDETFEVTGLKQSAQAAERVLKKAAEVTAAAPQRELF